LASLAVAGTKTSAHDLSTEYGKTFSRDDFDGITDSRLAVLLETVDGCHDYDNMFTFYIYLYFA